MAIRDFQAELKAAQTSVQALGRKREKLVGDAAVEESRVKQAVDQLTALGIENADKLTVAQLTKLREQSQAELEANLTTLQTQIAQAEKVMSEYEAVGA